MMASDEERPGDRQLRLLAREISILRKDLERADERASMLERAMSAFRRAVLAEDTGRLTAIAEATAKHDAQEHRRQAREASRRAVAEGGARELHVRPHASGAADVRINDSGWFRLARREASLLIVAAYAADVAEDRFPSWMPLHRVAFHIGRKVGREPTPRAIRQAVYILRKRLSEHGLNPYLLQTDRTLGVRFLLHR
jgi:hypothetical protein